jgi:hypothetical protein
VSETTRDHHRSWVQRGRLLERRPGTGKPTAAHHGQSDEHLCSYNTVRSEFAVRERAVVSIYRRNALRDVEPRWVTVGTFGDVAPERLADSAADHRADVNSLTCVLHEGVTSSKRKALRLRRCPEAPSNHPRRARPPWSAAHAAGARRRYGARRSCANARVAHRVALVAPEAGTEQTPPPQSPR